VASHKLAHSILPVAHGLAAGNPQRPFKVRRTEQPWKTTAAKPTLINRLRAGILGYIRERAADEQGQFTLTVPTGGGKTLASLAFAPEHAKRHGASSLIGATAPSSMRTSANAVSLACSSRLSRACRRHTVSRPRLTPLRRATSEMFASGSSLAATIRALSLSLQLRRWRVPVIISIR
jgi:hypothetical protein